MGGTRNLVDESDEEDDESDESHSINVAQGRKDRSKTLWPKGGTFKGKTFPKQDQKKSAVPPTHGNCYVWCLLYGEWDALTKANMIQMEVEQSVQELDTKEYYSAFLAMHSASAYIGVNLPVAREVLTIRHAVPTPGQQGNNPFHRNMRRRVTPLCSTPAGYGTLEVSAFHLKVHLSDEAKTQVKGRLDSGADITLISEDFFKELKGLPAPKAGLGMKLFSLTGNVKVLGYTTFDIEVEVRDGSLVIFMVKAYVCRGMLAPLLLGEDFSLTYAIGQHQTPSGRNHISFSNSVLTIPASLAASIDLGFEIRQAFPVEKSFVK
ncbi:hypothetical protein C8J56DRAFT_879754 [Mycena floridula]|nr:hypothetical protein C8J56DRAFT_879754 [Mycena floridula]